MGAICKGRSALSGLRSAAVYALAMALGLAAAPAHASTIVIDDFSQPNAAQFFAVPVGTNPSLQISQSSSGAIGGQRDCLFQVVGQSLPNSSTGMLGHDTTYTINAFQLATVGLPPGTAILQYSGTNLLNTPTSLTNTHGLGGGLGVDLTGGGTNNKFLFQFFGSDAQPTSGLDLSITVTSPGGKSSTASTVVTNHINPLTPPPPATFDVNIPFASLVGNVDLTHADSIVVNFNTTNHTPNIDFELKGISAVPEPSGLLLLVIAGALICTTLRLRRNRFALARVPARVR